jgi:peptide/nickel transport system substrate-binding protein
MEKLKKGFSILTAALLVSFLIVSCATPTASPTAAKPAAPAATTAPVAATKPAAAAPSPTAAAKPAATVAPTAAAPAVKIKRGGTLTAATDSTPRTLDFALSTGGGGPLFQMLNNTLLNHVLTDEKTSKFELKPELAESWKLVDPTTIELVLRKGVKFHDGTDFTAEVAKFNLDRIKNHPKANWTSTLVDFKSVEVVDSGKIRLLLVSPSATALTQISSGGYAKHGMVSKVAVEKDEEAFQGNPVGTGPMKFDRWVRDDRVVLKRFDGYWEKGADGQNLPYIEGFVERYMPDKAVALLELRAGGIDVVTAIDAKDVATVKSNPDLVYKEHPWRAWFYSFFFNPTKEPYASNKKLRQAAFHSVNRDGLLQALGFGIGKPYLYPFWSPETLGYDATIPYYGYDTNKSKQLLSEAGFPNGLEVKFAIIQRSAEVRMSEALKAMFDAVGIRTEIAALERTAWVQMARGLQYEMAMNRPSVRGDPDLQGTELLCKAPGNWAQYCNAELDKCFAAGRSEYDDTKRIAIYKRCQQILYEDAVFGTTYLSPENIVYSKKVENLQVQFYSDRFDARSAWLNR